MKTAVIPVNVSTMTAEINAAESGKVYIVSNGKVTALELPKFGETSFITHDGKIDRVETNEKFKI
ncbi:XtrA/YqaO family protein [Fictibacillus aquaticus]|uniref:DUF3954 domain-containing protein n=1 Tax=Fictibacillus aquaticus TaxID=2021314 RepID=A0A235F9F1_9BACL|nr:XtrA/YqaO family protein [Fictibacillus aquaticus]OYD57882.1 hypothetical protein CGZ90_08250 [Fictibacillus aquaticus]